MASRWERLLDTRPRPVLDYLVDEAAKLLAAELARWPLPTAEHDATTGAPFAALLESGSQRPSATAFAESFRLARWELSRDFEAYDDYMRNQRWLGTGLTMADKLALLFVSRYIVEQLLSLGESTEGRVGRRELLRCLDGIARLTLAEPSGYRDRGPSLTMHCASRGHAPR